MPAEDDTELPRRFAQEQSHAASAELVQRHLGCVYATALRRTGGRSDLAADATQQAFIALARQAHALIRHPTVAGWLYITTRRAALGVLRSERARSSGVSDPLRMKRLILPVLLVLANGLTALLPAAEFYVARGGEDANPGTPTRPFASVGRAQQAASPGDTVWIRGGEYVFSGTEIAVGVLFDKSGAPGRRINYFACAGETPVFDFFQLTTRARIKGFSVTGSWLHFRGLEVRGVQQILTNVNESWGIRVEGGSHNVFERLNLHHHEGPGLFIAAGGDNLVLNCDSHHNYDPDRGGQNADGFGSHSRDAGNVFRGCRAWANADDGYDFINSPGVATVEHSWAWGNGFEPDTDRPAGNGAGFKAGGFGLNRARFPAVVPRHVVRFCVAWHNRAQGFYANHHPGGLDWINNTAFDNPRNFDLLADQGPARHLLRNNLAHGPGGTLSRHTPAEIDDASNAWNLPVVVTDADFLSVMPAGVDGPRPPDGSLPRVAFLHLAPESKLIDAGRDMGFPFRGRAPDLGAFETEPPPAAPTTPAAP